MKIKSRELQWISKNPEKLSMYGGKWIALIDNRLIASGDSLNIVREEAKKITKKEPLVFKVPRKDEENYIL
jgi:hypothetical protein